MQRARTAIPDAHARTPARLSAQFVQVPTNDRQTPQSTHRRFDEAHSTVSLSLLFSLSPREAHHRAPRPFPWHITSLCCSPTSGPPAGENSEQAVLKHRGALSMPTYPSCMEVTHCHAAVSFITDAPNPRPKRTLLHSCRTRPAGTRQLRSGQTPLCRTHLSCYSREMVKSHVRRCRRDQLQTSSAFIEYTTTTPRVAICCSLTQRTPRSSVPMVIE